MQMGRILAGMTYTRGIVAIAAVVLVPGISSVAVAASPDQSPRAIEFRGTMRKLWQSDAIYMRAVTVSLLADMPDMIRNYQRLIQTQTEIGEAVRPYLGDRVADDLSFRLKEQVNAACATLTAAKSGDPMKLDEARTNWHQGAGRLAVFLSAIDSSDWQVGILEDLFGRLVDAVLDQAACRLRSDWAGDLAAFDAAHQQSLILADTLSLGIIHQVPGKFTSGAGSLGVVPVVTSAMAVPTQAGAQIVFDLSAPATVAVQVANIAGRPVRRVTGGYEAGAGLNSLLWNGCNDSGSHVPDGTYLVTVEVQLANGSASHATATLQLAR